MVLSDSVNIGFCDLTGVTDGMSLCGVGLLGWGRWNAHHLPRTHSDHQNLIQGQWLQESL